MIESIGKSWGAHVAQMVVSVDAIVHYFLVIGVQDVSTVVSIGKHWVRFTLFSAGKLEKKSHWHQFQSLKTPSITMP